MLTLTLPYPISANRYWATRCILVKGKWMPSTYVTSEARAYKEQVGWLCKAAGVRERMPGRVHVEIQMYPHRPQDYLKRMKANPLYWDDTVQRLDLDNARKVVNDALKEIVFHDDKCIFKDGGEVMEPDGRPACLVVTIRPYVRQVNPQRDLRLEEAAPAVAIPEGLPF